MNFLELVQRTVKESGAHLKIPDNLSNLDGLLLLFKDWVSEAWKEIQIERTDWSFLKVNQNFALSIAPGNPIIDVSTIADLHDANVITQQLVLLTEPADPETPPWHLTYLHWRDWQYKFPTSEADYLHQLETRAPTRPQYYTIAPDGNIWLDAKPDKAYVLYYWQNSGIQILTADADIPDKIRPDFHIMIVWKALMEYALYHEDRTVFERARMKYRPYKKYIEKAHLPNIRFVTDALYRGC